MPGRYQFARAHDLDGLGRPIVQRDTVQPVVPARAVLDPVDLGTALQYLERELVTLVVLGHVREGAVQVQKNQSFTVELELEEAQLAPEHHRADAAGREVGARDDAQRVAAYERLEEDGLERFAQITHAVLAGRRTEPRTAPPVEVELVVGGLVDPGE